MAWQVWERTVRSPWSVRMPSGLRLRCYPHSSAASGVIYFGLPDWWEMHFLLDYLRAGDAFVDVGANVGVYSLLAAGLEGVDVVAFEPSPVPRSRLLENLNLNALTSVTACPWAVGSETREVAMTVGSDTTDRVVAGPSGREAVAGPSGDPKRERVELVDQVTLDGQLDGGALDDLSVALVKIDVEGLEADVLRGAGRLIESRRPVLLIENNAPNAVAGILGPAGYSFYRYDPPTRSLVAIDPLDTEEPNVLACADVGAVLGRVRSEGAGTHIAPIC